MRFLAAAMAGSALALPLGVMAVPFQAGRDAHLFDNGRQSTTGATSGLAAAWA